MEDFYDDIGVDRNISQSDLVLKIEKLRLSATSREETSIEPVAGDDLVSLTQQPKEQLDVWRMKGEEMIANSQVAVLFVAGGLGTRLEFDLPKGFYVLDNLPSKKSLFQFLCEKIRRLEQNAKLLFPSSNPVIPVYIMENVLTHDQIVAFFKNHSYFGLNPDQVTFFSQENAPIIYYDGSQALGQSSEPLFAPNGNGGVYKSLLVNGCYDSLVAKKIQYVHFVGIDNIIMVPLDPLFIGCCAIHNVELGNKVVTKELPHERIGVFCWLKSKKNPDKPRQYAVVEYMELLPEEKELRDSSGRLVYRTGNILSHCLRIDFIKKCIDNDKASTYHVQKKENAYLNDNVPIPGKTYKFEKFIFDPFIFSNNALTVEFPRAYEFSPIKNKEGADSPQTARELLRVMWTKWIKDAGGCVVDGAFVEVSPLVSVDGRWLEPYVKGKTFKDMDIIGN